MPEFDLVAPVYDATRRPPSDAELDAVSEALGGRGAVLEGGVGTGRYSIPLGERGFAMTGVDISLEMMRRGRAKGLTRLVRANLYRLPFPEGTFDAALIVHVLQLLPDPFRALEELSRVARERVVTVVPLPSAKDRERREGLRERYRELAAARGIDIPPRTRYWENGQRLIERCPPESIRRVEVEEPRDPDRSRAWADLRTFGGLITVPPEVHEEIVAQLRAERGPRATPDGTRRHTLTVATWGSAQRAEIRAAAASAI